MLLFISHHANDIRLFHYDVISFYVPARNEQKDCNDKSARTYTQSGVWRECENREKERKR